MHRRCLLTLLTCLLASSAALAAIDARMLRFPDVSADRIAFVYAGDIWIAPKSGGQAVRLSTPAGEETFPRFSPDGKQIAFSGNYDGNQDIYVIGVDGGVPKRLTHHPMGDRMLDWYPDGKSVLYATSMHSGKQRFNQLYKLSAEGGMPEKLPVPYGEFGAIASDGRRLAYMPVTRDFRTWKRYRGGSTTDIWTFDLRSNASKNITTTHSNDGQPMWSGDKIYFISDRGRYKRANLWVHDTKSGQDRQLTEYREFDVRFPAIGGGSIVFENGGRLHLFDLASEQVSEVEIEVVTDRSTLKPRVESVADMIQGGNISPSGKRALIQARGDIFSVPAEHGIIRNLTRTPGVFERDPVWSPDGAEVAYWSDRSGEYELTVRAADGTGEETQLTELGAGFRYTPYWSPDGEKIAFIDQAMRLQLHDRESGKTTQLDQLLWQMHGGLANYRVSWSADSNWLAYPRDLDSRSQAIVLYDVDEGEQHQVTSGFYTATQPTFDPDGKYLYYLTNREFRPSYSDIDNSFIYPNTTRIAAVPLRADVGSPLAPRNDAEEAKKEEDDEDEGEDEKKDDKKKDKKDDEEEKLEIEIEGFESRTILLPPDAGNYGQVDAVAGKVLYQRRPNTGSGGNQSPIMMYDLEEREEKTILDNASGYALSADGKKMIVSANGRFGIISVAPKQKIDKPLRTSELRAEVDPVAEWKQIFNDAWRMERDYFYDPNMHGVDWNEMRRRYGKLIDDAVTRYDVNFVLGELIGELSASHAYRGGGDTENQPRMGVGLLGADYAIENGAYRIKHIVRGADWDVDVRSPLAAPGVDAKVGDYLLAVNGAPIDTTRDIWASFQGLAGTTVALTLSDDPEIDEDAREVLVETMGSETRLRNLQWIETNRRKVDEASGGRLGYIYVPSTGFDGQNELVRMFAGQWDKDGLVIDERFNNGGQIPDRFVELLNRPLYNYWAVRDGKDWQWPPIAHTGPKVMLINEWSGSGGDCFPYYFRSAGLGPLIGTTTWGGLIGISGSPGLIDNGGVTVPTFAFYGLESNWLIENEGVAPDIEVDDDPALMVDGGDPQLDAAIAEAMRLLRQNPPSDPARPAYPDRSGY